MENVATEEFISRTEAVKDFESCNAENPNWTPQRVKTLLLRQPAADVAEVVLCKDCQYYQDAKTNKKRFLICPASGMEISETDYCSYGSRMSQENKHKVRCAKCRKIKEIVCTVDGKPWCEDCFDKAMESGTKHETN